MSSQQEPPNENEPPTNESPDTSLNASQSQPPSKASLIGMGQLAILTVVTVASLRSLPAMAVYGLGSITLYVIPAIAFLVPTALVAAELATGWKGGVYVWVREALGSRWGFVAIWLQWVQNVVWFPVQLAFIAAAIAFMVGRDNLANSGVFTAIVIVVLYCLSTLITLRGGESFCACRLTRWDYWLHHSWPITDRFRHYLVCG